MVWEGVWRGGRGLWHKEATCATLKLQGLLAAFSEGTGCSLPAPHHSGHGSKNSKNQDYSYSMLWGMAWLCQRQLSPELGNNSVSFDQRQVV